MQDPTDRHRSYPDSVPIMSIEVLDCDRARQILAFVACTTDDPWDMLYGVSEADFEMALRLCHDDAAERREADQHDAEILRQRSATSPPDAAPELALA